MKKNLLIRIMTMMGGLSLWLTGLVLLTESFQQVGNSPLHVLLDLLLALLLCFFGTCCLMAVFPRKEAHRDFVMQKGENGTIGVSVRSIEGLVQTCVKQHPAIAETEISIAERRDGIIILMNVQAEAGVNIPLAVGAMQKQIKQYVSACTGLDVQEVRVMVENTDMRITSSPFAVQDAAPAAEIPAEPAEPVPPAEQLPVELPQEKAAEAAPVEEPVGVVMPPMPELVADEDDRPLHQRLFGAEEAPAIVPAPPQMTVEPETAPAPETAEAQADVEPETAAEQDTQENDEMDPNAVMEVIEAMSGEAAPSMEEAADGESADAEEPFTQDN